MCSGRVFHGVPSMFDSLEVEVLYPAYGLFALEPVVMTGVLLLLMGGGAMLTDGVWMDLEPLIEACRPKGKTPPQDLRRTLSAILWRHQNGAKWRAIPADLGPWSRAAQTFLRWARLGVWEKLLLLAQERGVQLGMTFLDGTSIRAHHQAAGAEKRGSTAKSAMSVKHWAVRVAATAPRPA